MISGHNRTFHLSSNFAKIIILIGFSLMSYMLYALTSKIYDNYTIDKYINAFSLKNQALIEDNASKIEDLKYYTSDAYVEKIAKQSLGLINPGEEVIIIPESSTSAVLESQIIEDRKKKEEYYRSNPIKWWRFFFIENPYK